MELSGGSKVPSSEREVSKKQRRLVKDKVHYLAVLAVAFVLVVGITALLKPDVIAENRLFEREVFEDNDDYESVEERLTKEEMLEATRASLQEVIGEEPVVRLQNFSNWDKTATRNNVFVVAPSSVAQIQQVVQAARREGLKVRCVGSAYSFSDLYADEEQLVVETKDLKTRQDGAPPIEITGEDMSTVTAAAGISQTELKEFFLENNVQYRSTVTPHNVLIGGLVGAASHGISAVRGSISDEVVAVRLVDAMGNLRSYNSSEDPESMAMLRCCVGMCGIIYEVTFKVESLSVATVEHRFPNSHELFNDTTTLVNSFPTTDTFLLWAPLSSLTYEQWQEYSTTGKIPESYDPWLDQYWMKTYTATNRTDLTRRRRSVATLKTNAVPPLVTGRIGDIPLVRHRRQANDTTDVPETGTAPPTESPNTTHTVLRDIHQLVWNYTYHMYRDVSPVDMYFPDATINMDGEETPIIYSMAFTFKDNARLNNTQKFLTLVLEKLREEAVAGRMPVLTLELSWLQPSRDCYLCAQNTAKDDSETAYWLAVTFVGASYKPDYEPFMNMTFNALKEEFPTEMRVEWAKFYSFVDGLQPFIRDSFGDAMTKFKDVYRESGIDPAHPEYRFTNEFLEGIFF